VKFEGELDYERWMGKLKRPLLHDYGSWVQVVSINERVVGSEEEVGIQTSFLEADSDYVCVERSGEVLKLLVKGGELLRFYCKMFIMMAGV
jgi:hypothetical protein